MEKAVSIIVGLAICATVLFLAVYVTWLFVERLRRKESVPKSFLRWLRDLFDLIPSW